MADTKQLSMAEVAKHSKRDDCWIVINGKAYDVTKFLDEHPGGEEVILEQAGADATEAFEDVGHSKEAREMLKKFLVGDVSDASAKGKTKPQATEKPLRPVIEQQGTSPLVYIAPLIVFAAIAYNMLFR